MGLFSLGKGDVPWNIEFSALSEDDIYTIAQLIRHLVGGFSSVEGATPGGERLANALRPYQMSVMHGQHLVVTDVLTTGEALRLALNAANARPSRGRRSATGVAVFARGQAPFDVKVLFQMPEPFWAKPRTR